MAVKRDPWQPIGDLICNFVLFVANATGYQPLTGGGSMPTEYADEPEPRWMLCSCCGHSTVHIPYFWVMDGDTDWECDQCGAVRGG